ncbi:hypothetical protein MKEN_00633900 [Mycena kentingensis (nom. inval.)]|nr:hypothetical protein MKEN_00633900 [Mycena kentingensis (nom. inval.)]
MVDVGINRSLPLTATTMSFAKLKAARDANARPSYVASDVPETSHQAAEEPRAAPASYAPDDALYRSIPRSVLEIRRDSDKGRGLWAKRNLGAGHTLLALPPYASALSTSNLATHCSLCTRLGASKRCSQCQIVHYCDSTCQTADWALHQLECAALRRCMASSEQEAGVPNDAIRCLARGMWRRRKKGFESDWAREMDAMQAHPPASPATHEQHTHLALSLVRFLGLTFPQELAEYGIQSGAELAQIVAKFTTNTFTLSSPDLTPLGACVSPPVALINHSCQPNAVIVFPGSKSGGKEPIMQVVAIRPIREGEEARVILTAYIDTTLPTELRRQALKETYSFDCDCSLCREAEAADPRASVWCPKRCGGLCRMPTDENPLSRCSTCGTVLRDTDAVLDATRVGQQGLDKATAVQFTDPEKARQLTTNLIPILASARLPPSAHPLLALRRLHLAMLIEDLASASPTSTPEQTQTVLDDVIVTATQVCAGLDAVLFPGHPVRALARAELGKLLAVDEPAPATSAPQKYPPSGPARLRTALETLLAARDELRVGFGVANEGGEVGNAVREDIVRLEKEMAVWKRGVGDAMKDAGLSLARKKATSGL